MSAFEIRPRFKLATTLNKQTFKDLISKNAEMPESCCKVSVSENHIFIRVPENRQHYWSPFLTLEMEEKDNTLQLNGLFGPSPAVWTMFVFFYTGIAFIGMIGLFYGLSQWSLNIRPTALWLVPITIILEVALYAISRTGQKLAHEQMQEIFGFLENIIT